MGNVKFKCQKLQVRTSAKRKKIFLLQKLFKTLTWASEVGFKKFKRVNNLILNHKFNQNKRIAKRGRKNLIKKSNEVKILF